MFSALITNKSLPQWARIVAWVGFPTVMALLLSWFMLSAVAADLAEIRSIVPTTEQNKQMLEQLLHYQRLICSNTAKTDGERLVCLMPVRP
jgi:hypothetical protein